MNFIALWFTKNSWLSDVASSLMGTVIKGIKTLVFGIDTFIYGLIINLYNFFMSLCTVRLLSSDILQELSQRIGYILGVVMLFYVVLSFIQMLLNPDAFSDNEKGAVSIIKRTILVIVMLGCSNYVFNLLYQVQNTIITSNIISKILLPSTVTVNVSSVGESSDNNSVMENSMYGGLITEELFMSFYKLEDFSDGSMTTDDSNVYASCQATVNSLRSQIVYSGEFDLGYNCLNEEIKVTYDVNGSESSDEQEASVVDFNYFLSPIVGLAVVYLMFMYCLKVGVRMVQLMFLEIISPMAIVSYLAPKNDTMFSKWKDIYIATYIDVFIRIAIINFSFFLIATVFSEDSEFGFTDSDLISNPLFVVVIVLGVLTFAKKAPDLIAELLPKSSSKLGFGIDNPKKFIGDLKGGIPGKVGLAAAAPIGYLAKKTISGIDSARSGQGFAKGWGTPKTKLGTSIDKFKQTYMPNSYELKKQVSEGQKEVANINNQWQGGVKVVNRLMKAGAGSYGAKGAEDKPIGWDSVFNGKAENKKYYKAVYKNENFVNSKMNLDAESSIEDELRRGVQKVQAGGEFSFGGKTYNVSNFDALVKEYEGQQKKVSGLKTVHDSMRKQYIEDAQTEDNYKFIKANEANPTNPSMTRQSRGI